MSDWKEKIAAVERGIAFAGDVATAAGVFFGMAKGRNQAWNVPEHGGMWTEVKRPLKRPECECVDERRQR